MPIPTFRIVVTVFLFYLECMNFVMSRGDGGEMVNWQQQQGWNTGNNKGGGGPPLGGWDDEVRNPWGGYPEDTSSWKLEDSIPGIPGKSYPSLDKIPETSFDCGRQKGPGYYGDVEAQCQVFHICQAGGRQNSFLCPVGTIFNQETFVCDWWFNVNCAESSTHFDRNSNLFRGSDIGIDGVTIQRQSSSKGSDQLPPVGIPTWDQGEGRNRGMKGSSNQNKPMARRQGPSGGRGRDEGRKGQEKGSTTWPSRGGSNQNDLRRGREGGWGQQQRSDMGRRRDQNRGPQKGPAVNQNSRHNQKGDAAGGNQRRGGDPQRDGRRQRSGHRNKGGREGMRNRDYNPQRNTNKGSNVNNWNRGAQNLQNSDKGSNVNNWDMGPQNLQNSDKGSNVNNWNMGLQNLQNSDKGNNNMWGKNQMNNSPDSFQGNRQWQNNMAEDGAHNNEHFKGDNVNNLNRMNNPWRANVKDEHFAQINNFGENYNYDYNYNENTWSHKNKEVSRYQEVENNYDYNS